MLLNPAERAALRLLGKQQAMNESEFLRSLIRTAAKTEGVWDTAMASVAGNHEAREVQHEAA
jgi:hypothetical protein